MQSLRLNRYDSAKIGKDSHFQLFPKNQISFIIKIDNIYGFSWGKGERESFHSVSMEGLL